MYSDVLEVWPNLNLKTIHSSVMVPALKIFQTRFETASNNTDPADF